MAHALDGHGSEQLRADAQRLVARSREHEQRLSSLVTSLEREGESTRRSTHSVAAAGIGSRLDLAGARPEIPNSIDLLALVRDLCVAARQQRQRIETLVTRMLGDLAVEDAHHVRVLVVDDSDDNRELATIVLEAAGYHVITARNGLEAIVAAHSEHPAIVLMDVTMPVLDGIEAARLIKESAGTRHMKILAHTANPEFYEGPLTRLFVDVLRKPSTPEGLVVAVRRLVELAPPEDGSRAQE
jgi:two-component system, cell cycle response regulator DivK